jgi:CRP-like cAMP-binding protein
MYRHKFLHKHACTCMDTYMTHMHTQTPTQGESAGNSIVPNSMYVVKTGILEVFRNGIERGNVVSFLTAGFTAGERALLTKKEYAASVKARTPVVLGVVPIEVVKEIIAGNSSLQTKLKLFSKSKEFDANSSVGKSSTNKPSSAASFIEEERIMEEKIKHKAKKMEQILKAKEEQDANREKVWRDEGRLSAILLEVLPALIRDSRTGNLR